jgi:hypothetical protein
LERRVTWTFAIGRWFTEAQGVEALVFSRQGPALQVFEGRALFWDVYAETLVEKGKDAEYLRSTFRNSLGWNGFFVLGAF